LFLIVTNKVKICDEKTTTEISAMSFYAMCFLGLKLSH